jgi:hypothetical protein
MTTFCLGVAVGCVAVAAVVSVTVHIILETADGRLAGF